MARGWPPLLLLLALAAACLVLIASGTLADRGEESGQPRVVPIAREQKVFDFDRDACEARDIPDHSARAFRDFRGRVHLYASHTVTRGFEGASLDSARYSCSVAFRSSFDPRPSQFRGSQWISAPYTIDGRTVHALVHNEYHGAGGPETCPSANFVRCQYNAITLATSTDGGVTFTQRPPPYHLVATAPHPYVPNAGPYGLFQPSNIVRKGEHFYAMLQSEPFGGRGRGTCLMRTRNLADPTSWRAWDGKGFGVRFVNPYGPRFDPSKHLCKPVSAANIGVMSSSLTFNTYLDKFVLVATTGERVRNRRAPVWGVYFSVSDDLVHWSRRRLITRTELTSTYRCGDRAPISYPSLLDPKSRARNFETTGRRPYLYFVRLNPQGCRLLLNRDLVRRQVEFRK